MLAYFTERILKCENNPDDLSNQLINQIKKWLKHEIKHQQPIVDGKEILTDGTEGICEGRHECAKSLLNQIKKWEKKLYGND